MSFNQGNPLVWFEIYVQDMARARTFYEAVFDIQLENMPSPTAEMNMEMWGFPSNGDSAKTSYGACGSLVKMEGVPSGAGGTLVYFSCVDCAIEAARAVEYGGILIREKMSIGEFGHIALVQDTEGNLIGLHTCDSQS